MIIGVFSDSHDNIEKIKKAVSFFNDQKVDLVIHAGDFVAPFAIAPMEELNCQLVCVFGNNDGERIGLYNRIKDIGEVHNNLADIGIDGRRICAVHYPELAEPIALSGLYDLVIYGHTHKIDIRTIRTKTDQSETVLLNPGETGGWVTGRSTLATVDLNSMSVEIFDL